MKAAVRQPQRKGGAVVKPSRAGRPSIPGVNCRPALARWQEPPHFQPCRCFWCQDVREENARIERVA